MSDFKKYNRYLFDREDLDTFVEFLTDMEDGLDNFKENYPDHSIELESEMNETGYVVTLIVEKKDLSKNE